MTVITICRLGHQTKHTAILNLPQSFPRVNWRCRTIIDKASGKKCGEPLIDTESGVITTPELRMPDA